MNRFSENGKCGKLLNLRNLSVAAIAALAFMGAGWNQTAAADASYVPVKEDKNAQSFVISADVNDMSIVNAGRVYQSDLLAMQNIELYKKLIAPEVDGVNNPLPFIREGRDGFLTSSEETTHLNLPLEREDLTTQNPPKSSLKKGGVVTGGAAEITPTLDRVKAELTDFLEGEHDTYTVHEEEVEGDLKLNFFDHTTNTNVTYYITTILIW